jgi:hypothetical protein
MTIQIETSFQLAHDHSFLLMPVGFTSLCLSRNGFILHPQSLQLVFEHFHLVEVSSENGDPVSLDEFVDLLMSIDLLYR